MYMKKSYENFVAYLKYLYSDKTMFYLVLNCFFGILAITCFIIKICGGFDYQLAIVGWTFIAIQWVCLILQIRAGKRYLNGKF